MHRKNFFSAAAALVLPLAMLACGGGEQGGDTAGGEQQQATAQQDGGQQGALTVPDWMTVDEANESVTLEIVAGQDNSNNNWNYNGYHSGDGTIVVPEGWNVTIEFSNNDQVNAHSISIESQVGDYGPTFEQADPVFEGAATTSPTQMAEATQPGQSESISFTASTAGEYAMVCLVPAHAAQGMWLPFNVSADGEVGFRAPA